MRLKTLTMRLRTGIDKAAVHRLAESLLAMADAVASKNGAPHFAEISLFMTGDRTMERVHMDAMGLEGTTDVVTLPYAEIPGVGATAEIFVNADLAAERGKDRAALELVADEGAGEWSPQHELALYIAHGFDHLAGGEDSAAAGFRAMRLREIRWVRKAETAGLLAGLYKNKGGSQWTKKKSQ